MKLMSLPPLASEHGVKLDNMMYYIHFLMALLFVIWIVYFAYTLFRFSAKRNPKASYTGYTGKASTWLEIGVAVFEGVLLVGMAIPLWAKAADGFPDAKDSTVIRITAQQFAWNSRYPGPDGKFGPQDLKFLATENKFGIDMANKDSVDDILPPLNEIAVPVDKPVILNITSMDVIHSFAVHPLRITQDAIPGVSIATHFKPTRVGDYQITCAQLCGNSHYFMKGFFKVLTPEKYAEWIAKQPKLKGGTSFE